jgi:hypothetical protein
MNQTVWLIRHSLFEFVSTFGFRISCFLLIVLLHFRSSAAALEPICVSKSGTSFVTTNSGRPFVPWGFNYDRDDSGRLLEDYWDKEWPKVEADFHEMKRMKANVVRVHLQVARFLDTADKPNEANLARLGRLVGLAEKEQLYLDVTGVGCYNKRDVPAWYDRLSEANRWKAQGRFWEVVADRCSSSPAIFCYDLMNEPVVPGGARKPGEWLGPPLGDKYYVQFITLDQKDRQRPAIARQWCHELVASIRRHDRAHLITVGCLPWGRFSGFEPKEISPELDFMSVHIYPEAHKVGTALDMLQEFSVGKPVVVEEMYPLNCSMDDLASFVDQSRARAQGWIGFYWGKTTEDCRKSGKVADGITAGWLDWFQRHGPP